MSPLTQKLSSGANTPEPFSGGPLSDFEDKPIRGKAAAALLPALRRFEFPGKFRLLKHVSKPRSGCTVSTFPGGVRLHLDMKQRVEREYFQGLADLFELSLVRRFLASGGDAVDIGGYIGLWAITEARAVSGSGGRVLVVEPHPIHCQRIRENIELNGCTNVVVVDAAASDEAGFAKLAVLHEEGSGWSTLSSKSELPPIAQLDVRTTTVDAEVARYRLEPSFVKIDVEGWELAVLRGMTQTLARRPVICCELGVETAVPVAKQLEPREYVALRVDRRRLVRRLAAGWSNVFFVPSERLSEIPRRLVHD